ncbi:MAG: hypothetical protein ABSF64_07415 [Bryobacteraceae bacterium]
MLLLGHLELIERGYQVLHHGVECIVGDAPSFVRRYHIGARVTAGSARALAQEIGELLFVRRGIRGIGSGVRKPLVDALVRQNPAYQIVHDRADSGHAAEPLIQTLVRFRGCQAGHGNGR